MSPIFDPSGRVIGASSVARDIGNEVRARREMADMRAASDRRTVVIETAGRVALDILSSRTGVEALQHIALMPQLTLVVCFSNTCRVFESGPHLLDSYLCNLIGRWGPILDGGALCHGCHRITSLHSRRLILRSLVM